MRNSVEQNLVRSDASADVDQDGRVVGRARLAHVDEEAEAALEQILEAARFVFDVGVVGRRAPRHLLEQVVQQLLQQAPV